MRYLQIDPPDLLSSVVRSYAIVEDCLPTETDVTHHLTADPCPTIVFHYQNQFLEYGSNGNISVSPISHYHGQTNLPQKLSVKGSYGLFCIYLNPFASQHFFGIPADELTTEQLSLSELLGTSVVEVEEKMIKADGDKARIKIADSFVLDLMKKSAMRYDLFDMTISDLLQNHQKLDYWFRELKLSRRQFERRFKPHAGYSPLQFQKLVRFNRVLKNLKPGSLNLTQIAMQGGYFDQSHFIRDFKQYSGFSPAHYFRSIEASADNFTKSA